MIDDTESPVNVVYRGYVKQDNLASVRPEI